LPGEASETHDVVAYNLGLAYSRYGDFPLASKQLESVIQRADSPLSRKAQSLLKRIKSAAAHGTALTLFGSGRGDDAASASGEGPKDPALEGEDEGADAAAANRAAAAVLEVPRGDLCLYGIFQSDTIEKEALRLLAKAPRFVERDAIERSETMTSINSGR
jgi:hypothetical protein